MPDRSISPRQAEFENIPNFGDAGEVLDVVNDKVLIFDADDAEGGDINSNKGQKPKVITVGELRSFSAANTNFKMISSLYAVQDADMGGVLIASSDSFPTTIALTSVTVDGRIILRANDVQPIFVSGGITETIGVGEQKELVRANGVWQALDEVDLSGKLDVTPQGDVDIDGALTTGEQDLNNPESVLNVSQVSSLFQKSGSSNRTLFDDFDKPDYNKVFKILSSGTTIFDNTHTSNLGGLQARNGLLEVSTQGYVTITLAHLNVPVANIIDFEISALVSFSNIQDVHFFCGLTRYHQANQGTEPRIGAQIGDITGDTLNNDTNIYGVRRHISSYLSNIDTGIAFADDTPYLIKAWRNSSTAGITISDKAGNLIFTTLLSSFQSFFTTSVPQLYLKSKNGNEVKMYVDFLEITNNTAR